MEYLLELNNISKSFPGVKALDDVTVKVRPNTVHALVGENGAGKSTLMKCLFGIYKKDSGSIILSRKEVSFATTAEAMRGGIAMVHQELNQVHTRSVMENVWLHRFPKFHNIPGTVDHKKTYRDTEKIFNDMDIHIDPRAIIRTLSTAQRQMVEIAKAVSFGAKVIVLDEPTSSLADNEVMLLFKIIELLKKRGCGVIYISHRMNEILRISDDVTIMRDGKHVSSDSAKNLTIGEIIKRMVGRELTNVYPAKTNKPGEVMLEADHFSCVFRNVKNVSFKARKGEILGFAGLVGAGRTELVESLFGLSTLKSGNLKKNGKPINNHTPIQAMKNRFALVTEERRATGIFAPLDIQENTVICNLKSYLRGKIYLSKKKMLSDTLKEIKRFSIKTVSTKTKIRSLSGGNQQKVILGRWMLTEPDVLLLDEPTRGIDVGAKYEIYQIMIDLASEGKSILMVSSELPELLGVCDRIIVMSNGQVAGDVDPKVTSQEEIMALAGKFVE
ncbi:MAG: sugar ABC transporter ATP-binding protein [Oscillospiraceae bacterium]|nr:sugar ABC transporter ATP-binding protein [Oscillospiraceae bacterium]